MDHDCAHRVLVCEPASRVVRASLSLASLRAPLSACVLLSLGHSGAARLWLCCAARRSLVPVVRCRVRCQSPASLVPVVGAATARQQRHKHSDTSDSQQRSTPHTATRRWPLLAQAPPAPAACPPHPPHHRLSPSPFTQDRLHRALPPPLVPLLPPVSTPLERICATRCRSRSSKAWVSCMWK